MIINSDYSTFCIPKIWEDKRGFCPHSSLFHAFSRQDQNRLQSFFTLHLFYLQYPVNFPYFWFLLYLFKSSFFKCTNVSRIFPEKDRREYPFLNSFSKVDIDRVFRQSGILLQGVSICFLPFCYTLKNVLLSIHGPFFAQDCVKAIMTSIEKTMTSKYEKLEVYPLFESKTDQIKEWAENPFTLFSFTTIEWKKRSLRSQKILLKAWWVKVACILKGLSERKLWAN